MVEAIQWTGKGVRLLDQTQLPVRVVYEKLTTIEAVYRAIQEMHVRGAPAIGITAAYGLYLGIKDTRPADTSQFLEILQQKALYLQTARPTAVNLKWALETIVHTIQQRTAKYSIEELIQQVLELAKAIHEDDRQRCNAIGQHGATLIPSNARVLTHCNTGALATGGIGTALGIIYIAHQQGKIQEVLVDETRPVLQGARLTTWELDQAGVPFRLITDNMAGWFMQQGKVDAIVVGADRITRDGYVANKIGTYSLAVLAHHHNIPFYVAAPLSTFDPQLSGGTSIPIEERSCQEVVRIFNQVAIAPEGTPCYNPAFDITPPELIRAIITEAGIIEPVNEAKIETFLQEQPIQTIS